MSRFDLHIHSCISDGTYPPSEVLKRAAGLGLHTIAIADHDTVEGVEEAIETGERLGVRVIPALEINTDYKDAEIHVLGYFIDYRSEELKEYLSFVKDMRVQRVLGIAHNIAAIYGIDISAADVIAQAGGGILTRAHIDRALYDKNVVSSMAESAEKYTGRSCPAYVPRNTATVPEAIEIIKRAGGIPVLAHPGRQVCSAYVEEILDLGVEGIEAYYFTHTPEQVSLYRSMASDRGLIITGGSDCHGVKFNRTGRDHMGLVDMPDSVVDGLIEYSGGRADTGSAGFSSTIQNY